LFCIGSHLSFFSLVQRCHRQRSSKMRSFLLCLESQLIYVSSRRVRRSNEHSRNGGRFCPTRKISPGQRTRLRTYPFEKPKPKRSQVTSPVLRGLIRALIWTSVFAVTLAIHVAAQSNAEDQQSQANPPADQSVPNQQDAAKCALMTKSASAQSLCLLVQEIKREEPAVLPAPTPRRAPKTEVTHENNYAAPQNLPPSNKIQPDVTAVAPSEKSTQPNNQPPNLRARSTPISVAMKHDCPEFEDNPLMSQYPPIQRQGGSGFWRPPITDDFLVLEYNAGALETRWYDYRHPSWNHTGSLLTSPQKIYRNGEFLPIVYAKEKILIHVCGLHFTDIVTIATNSTGLPEGGLDIRGANPTTTVPTLTPALDSIQAIGATGQAATIGGLGFSATTPITTNLATGISNGTVMRSATGVTYTDANISASPQELALMMYAVRKNAIELSHTIKGEDLALHIKFRSLNPPDLTDRFLLQRPTSIDRIALEAVERYNQAYADDHNPDKKLDPAAFDRDLTNVQNLSTELTNFFGALSTQGYGSRAVALWNNYAILRAPLNMMEDHLRKKNCIQSTEAQATQAAADQAAEAYSAASIAELVAINKAKAAKDGTPEKDALQKVQADKHAATEKARTKLKSAEEDAAKKTDSTTPSNQDINCDDWETKNNRDFLREYRERLFHLAESDPSTAYEVMRWRPTQMFEDLGELRGEIDFVTTVVGRLYEEINTWNENPYAEQSDFVTPISGNALERISISVQHGYVPFTLSSYALSTAPTVTTPPAPTTNTAATTSIPAHTVKTVMVEVHRRVNLNLIGGVMNIKVPNSTYAVQQ
jgi:hypothetical protein